MEKDTKPLQVIADFIGVVMSLGLATGADRLGWLLNLLRSECTAQCIPAAESQVKHTKR